MCHSSDPTRKKGILASLDSQLCTLLRGLAVRCKDQDRVNFLSDEVLDIGGFFIGFAFGTKDVHVDFRELSSGDTTFGR